MAIKDSKTYKAFAVLNYIVLGGLAVICLFPVYQLIILAFSTAGAIAAGKVVFWPSGFNWMSYEITLKTIEFWRAYWITIQRCLLAIPLTLITSILMAYPLSKAGKELRGRSVILIIFLAPMFISGGFIPLYLWIGQLRLFDTVWALVLPGLVSFGTVIFLMNTMRMLPKELEEAAFIDGASYFKSLVYVVLPLSKAALATQVLFIFIANWNSWFDGMIYNKNSAHYPLQTFLTAVVNAGGTMPTSMVEMMQQMNVAGPQVGAAQLFLAMIPVLLLYPFLQRYFVKGVVVGSVKG